MDKIYLQLQTSIVLFEKSAIAIDGELSSMSIKWT